MSDQDLQDAGPTIERIGQLLDGFSAAGWPAIHGAVAGYVRERRGKVKGVELPFGPARDLLDLLEELERLIPVLSDPDALTHTVTLDEDGFGIQHPITERGEDLLDCPLHTWLRSLPGPPGPNGRYLATRAGAGWALERR